MPTPVQDLAPGDTYTLGDPGDPAHPHTVHPLHGPGAQVIQIPVATHTHDAVFPGDTLPTN